MSTGLQYSDKSRPTVFERPTLGHTVRLGELFDERINQFLGAQLYREDATKFDSTVSDVNRTDLSLSLSDSVMSKVSILDIDPSHSLDVLTGLVKAKGSASYPKSNWMSLMTVILVVHTPITVISKLWSHVWAIVQSLVCSIGTMNHSTREHH